MDITHEHEGRAGRFSLNEGADEAELTYSPGRDAAELVFDHTYVPHSLRGRGIAESLVEHGVAYARDNEMRIVPACSYVRALFDRHPDRYADVRAR